MGERRRGRRQSPASGTVKHKRGALAELRETLTPEQHARLERAVNRKRRGMPPEHPQRSQRSQLEERCKAASVKAAELYRASVVELQRAQALAIELDELDELDAALEGDEDLEDLEGLEDLEKDLEELAQAVRDEEAEVEAPQCVTLTPDRWCAACGRARATKMCGVCGGSTSLISDIEVASVQVDDIKIGNDPT